jgi:hypothetical protein
VRAEDCFPVSRSHKFLQQPMRVPLRELCCEGTHPTYVEVLKRVPMVEGGAIGVATEQASSSDDAT